MWFREKIQTLSWKTCLNMKMRDSDEDIGTSFPIDGVSFGAIASGIKKTNRKDLLLIALKEGCVLAGVFTLNKFCAAPVQICRARLKDGASIGALIINTGIANAGTGAEGLATAQLITDEVARLLNIPRESVLPFSTGVIMEQLPAERILRALPTCVDRLGTDDWADAAKTILTTDLVYKLASKKFQIQNFFGHVTGIAKGSGMIKPNMATMLAFVATDIGVEESLAKKIAKYAADRSFNCISVDGDTSTNDSFVFIATGRAAYPKITDESSEAYKALRNNVTDVCQDLAKKIVMDGEGATKFIEIRVNGARDRSDARKVAFSVANSPLVKTAFFASDPNLGRIMSAIGAADVADLNVLNVSLFIGDVIVAKHGAPAPSYAEAQVKPIMSRKEITVTIELGMGSEEARVWTCDLSYDYVKINAEYRS